MKNFNGRFIEIDGIDIPILLEDGLDIDFAKNTLSKCNTKEFKDGDLLINNKEKFYILHNTIPIKISQYAEEQNFGDLIDYSMTIKNFKL